MSEGWISPRLAAARFEHYIVGQTTIRDWLSTGELRAQGSRIAGGVPEPIPVEFWKVGFAKQNWSSGRFATRDAFHRDAVEYCSVQFSLADLEGLLSANGFGAAPALTSDGATQRPRLSDSQLNEWWAKLEQRFDVAKFSEAELQGLVANEFPNHTVARDRLRALRGSVKSGPKTAGA